jgi:branched-subunit amino acid aminotransferase/4-amino-4-deoxychorismate lyase
VEQLDEAFITSSSRGLVPVVRIAGRPVGRERPGPVTQRLLVLYDDTVRREVCTALEVVEEGNS